MDHALALILAGFMMRLIVGCAGLRSIPRPLVQGLIVPGGLALPTFAFHRIVIPVKDRMIVMDVARNLAVLSAPTTYVAAVAWGARRPWVMYFPCRSMMLALVPLGQSERDDRLGWVRSMAFPGLIARKMRSVPVDPFLYCGAEMPCDPMHHERSPLI